jgi:hypothetical protein
MKSFLQNCLSAANLPNFHPLSQKLLFLVSKRQVAFKMGNNGLQVGAVQDISMNLIGDTNIDKSNSWQAERRNGTMEANAASKFVWNLNPEQNRFLRKQMITLRHSNQALSLHSG